MKGMVENLRANEASLTEKIKRRQIELENSDKRLQGLEQVRPQYMDEYERLEEELQRLYGLYVDKFRNLDYLESELDTHTRREEMELQKHMKEIIKFEKEQPNGYADEDDEKIAGGQLIHNEKMASTRVKFNQGGVGSLEHEESSEE